MLKVAILVGVFGFTICNPTENSYLPPNQGLPAANTAAALTGSSNAAAIAEAYSTSKAKPVPILKFSTDNDGEGTYSYNYETGNGITAEEQGDARGDGTKARGSYSFTLPDGQHVSLTYTADENGFVAQGSHIPTAGPIPEAILKALQENAAAEARGIFDDGQYHGEGLEESQYKEGVQGSDSVSIGSAKAQSASGASEGYKY